MFKHKKRSYAFKTLSLFVLGIFLTTSIIPPSYAQAIGSLVDPVPVIPAGGFIPTHIEGLTINPDNPLQFQFIVDYGQEHLTQG